MRLLWSLAGADPAPRCREAIPVSQLETAPWTAENGPRGSRVSRKRAAAGRGPGPTEDQHAKGWEPVMNRHRRPHSSRSTPQTSSELWGMGGLQHASTNAAHGESPKSFRLLSRGPVRLGERCTCYYLPSYEAQQSMLLARTVRFSVTKRQGDACEREGMHGHGQDAQADPQVPRRWRARSQACDG